MVWCLVCAIWYKFTCSKNNPTSLHVQKTTLFMDPQARLTKVSLLVPRTLVWLEKVEKKGFRGCTEPIFIYKGIIRGNFIKISTSTSTSTITSTITSTSISASISTSTSTSIVTNSAFRLVYFNFKIYCWHNQDSREICLYYPTFLITQQLKINTSSKYTQGGWWLGNTFNNLRHFNHTFLSLHLFPFLLLSLFQFTIMILFSAWPILSLSVTIGIISVTFTIGIMKNTNSDSSYR